MAGDSKLICVLLLSSILSSVVCRPSHAPLNTPRDEGSRSHASPSWNALAALLNSMVASEPVNMPTMRAHEDFTLIQNSVASSGDPKVDPDVFTHDLSSLDAAISDALSITTADISDISAAAGLATSAGAARASSEEAQQAVAAGNVDSYSTDDSSAAYEEPCQHGQKTEIIDTWWNEEDEYADIDDLPYMLPYIGDHRDLRSQTDVDEALQEARYQRAYVSAWSDEYAEDIKISIQADGSTDTAHSASSSNSHVNDAIVVTDVPGAGAIQDVYAASDSASVDDWVVDLYAHSDDQQQAQQVGNSEAVADIKVTVTVTKPSSDGEEAGAAFATEETWVAVDGPGDHVVLLRGHQKLPKPRHGQQPTEHPILSAGSDAHMAGGDASGMQPMYGDADQLAYETEFQQDVVDDFQTVMLAIKLVAAQAALVSVALVLHMWRSSMLEARISKLEAVAVLAGKAADLV